jgi:hypothetical protein
MDMRFFLFLTLVVFAFAARAEVTSGYKSDEDVQLTIRTLTLLPVFDNMRGIYARPVEADLTDKIKAGHRFEYVEAGTSGPVMTPDELEDDPTSVKNIFQGFAADAFVVTSIIKGPGGIAIKMDLFLKSDQQLLAQESINAIQRFDTEGVKKQSNDLLERLLKKIPYNGLILSRQGTRVTLNLGTKDGINVNQMVSVIQIIKSVRHPKFHFLVSTEKEVIGKVKVLKVDDTLSFGRIVTEKGAGSIQPNSKIATVEDVTYSNTDSLSDTQSGEDVMGEKPDAKINYGKNPVAWLPEHKPTFGVVGARIGVGQFQENTDAGGTSTLSSYAAIYPSIALEGELWLTPAWSMHAQIRQGIITTSNPVPSGSPSTLSHRLSVYDFLFGYNMRLANSIAAPKVEVLFGYSSYELYVDQSNPVGLTTKTYSGPKFGVSGTYPLGPDSSYSLGANLDFMIKTSLSESPSISGSGSSSATTFGAFVDKQLYVNLKARYQLDFEIYETSFDSGGSASQKHTTVSGGLYYLF